MDSDVGENRVINSLCALCVFVHNVTFPPVTSRLKEPPFCSGTPLQLFLKKTQVQETLHTSTQMGLASLDIAPCSHVREKIIWVLPCRDDWSASLKNTDVICCIGIHSQPSAQSARKFLEKKDAQDYSWGHGDCWNSRKSWDHFSVLHCSSNSGNLKHKINSLSSHKFHPFS